MKKSLAIKTVTSLSIISGIVITYAFRPPPDVYFIMLDIFK